MAIAIKNIPVLKGEAAQKFIQRAEAASKRKGSIDFSVQAKAAQRILDQAGMK